MLSGEGGDSNPRWTDSPYRFSRLGDSARKPREIRALRVGGMRKGRTARPRIDAPSRHSVGRSADSDSVEGGRRAPRGLGRRAFKATTRTEGGDCHGLTVRRVAALLSRRVEGSGTPEWAGSSWPALTHSGLRSGLFGVCREQPERGVGAEWSHRAEVSFVQRGDLDRLESFREGYERRVGQPELVVGVMLGNGHHRGDRARPPFDEVGAGGQVSAQRAQSRPIGSLGITRRPWGSPKDLTAVRNRSSMLAKLTSHANWID